MADVEDALVWGVDLTNAVETLIEEGRIPQGGIDFSAPPKPDPTRPGQEFLGRLTDKQMNGGHVRTGEWECDSCGKPFYMEVAVNAKGAIIDSLGGILFPPNIALCDDCSPI